MLLLFSTLLLSLSVSAQYVTSSFDAAEIGENPASAATRTFGIVSPMASFTHTQQKIEDPHPASPGIGSRAWDRDTKLQRYDFVLAGKGMTYVPEVFLGIHQGNQVAKAAATEDDSTDFKTSNTLFNNQLNVGINTTNNWKTGIILFVPQVNYSYSGTYKSSGYQNRTDYRSKRTIIGTGFGTTYFIWKSFAVGGFYTLITESEAGEQKNKTNNDAEVVSNLSGTATHQKFGGGLAYQVGNSKSGGFRMELSHSKIKWRHAEDHSAIADSQNRISFEATTLGFTAGVNFTRTYGSYLNFRYLLESVLEQKNSSNKPTNAVGGFIGFKTANGSSISGFATFYKGTDIINFQGGEPKAATTRYALGVNYAYAF